MVGNHSNCGACRFWQDHNIIGLCRRYPTHQNKQKHEWCGEWVPAESPAIVALPVVEMRAETLSETLGYPNVPLEAAQAEFNKAYDVYAKEHGLETEKAAKPKRKYTRRQEDRKSTRLNSSHIPLSRMPSSA